MTANWALLVAVSCLSSRVRVEREEGCPPFQFCMESPRKKGGGYKVMSRKVILVLGFLEEMVGTVQRQVQNCY